MQSSAIQQFLVPGRVVIVKSQSVSSYDDIQINVPIDMMSTSIYITFSPIYLYLNVIMANQYITWVLN